MIEITNLTKKTRRATAIDNLTFSARPRECLGLFGHDGAGKSTLLKLLCGATRATSGTIKIYDMDISTHPIKAQTIIGYQPEFALGHGNMTVKSFLGFMAEVRGLRGQEKRKMVDRAIARLELWRVLDSPISALPPGHQRKVALAQAILHDPKLLLLDEPTEGLDTLQKQKVGTLIQSLTEDMTVIVASRNPEEFSSICQRALVLAEGRLLADTSVSELQHSSRHYQAITLAADTPLDLLALAVLPGVAGIEEDRHADGSVTVLAMPGQIIYPHVNALIANRRWKINALSLEPGRLSDVIHHLSQEAPN
ncbi:MULTISPECIES: ABC transporter ATP-binding protein [Pseudomonas]|uniref:ABC transporter ATP-binding protein n=1 Tax=Pseudomonas gessardii TaxID=78544 RepID=A0A7Y1QP32_9PSED|nr:MULTISPECIES: ABC transporter ATP-binding protein [Pseudomonas]MCF4979736.1 ATP-binding cassette domain-containing protein [Pseudomonas gessardii]MCF4992995.1 ATP-binding cassette domain-containing protein [Pseudomonas gessardii]MCF5086029.1 ATP-binding cassette domain-containing protein [Pseudomonas gessardii]MCF5098501.1 ATP-binding cassette domain-containing protein [Pseudomonas gessardii]MCF5107955.1 ATP-binding cassette domain-containing protein [Pseudomonas gessardii]